MLCGVTATLGSNPSATATAARPQWGRAVLLCPRWRMRVLGGAVWRWLLLVAPRVFRAPEGPAVGPGCCVCPWAAACPRAVRAASFARRVVSMPGLASPPPTGTAAGSSGALHTCGAWCAYGWLAASARCPARPRHRPRAPPPCPPVPPAPSTPVGLGRCLDPYFCPAHGCRSLVLRSFRCVLLQTSSIGGVFRVDF